MTGGPVCDIVIPALNESSSIDALFDALDEVPVAIRNIVVADNGSTDDTPDLAAARGAQVVHEPQRGYGAACQRGLAWIAGRQSPPDLVVFLDADLADDPVALTELLRPFDDPETAIVLGQRLRHAEPGALNPVQKFGTRLACTLIALTTGRRYRDLGPFRVVRWPVLARLRMADRTWGWTVELQMKAALLDLRVVEVDVRYRRRHAGRSKISGTLRGVAKAGTKIIVTIAVLWWRRKAIRRAGEWVDPAAAACED